jgi:quinol-cytochrome oxidoreductase complex cytochrome b subunit
MASPLLVVLLLAAAFIVLIYGWVQNWGRALWLVVLLLLLAVLVQVLR